MGGILIVAEIQGGKIREASFELATFQTGRCGRHSECRYGHLFRRLAERGEYSLAKMRTPWPGPLGD